MNQIGYRKQIDYHLYLKSDAWKEKAKACRKRAGFRCQICATENRELHAHHNSYENLGDEKPEDLICLCDLCHEGITEMLKNRRMK